MNIQAYDLIELDEYLRGRRVYTRVPRTELENWKHVLESQGWDVTEAMVPTYHVTLDEDTAIYTAILHVE